MEITLPYLSREKKRGQTAYYVRINGKRIRLHAVKGSPEFFNKYRLAVEALKSGQPIAQPQLQEKTNYTKGKLGWLIQQYLTYSQQYQALSDNLRRKRARTLEKLSLAHGDMPMVIPHNVLVSTMQAMRDTPEAANDWLKTIRGLYNYAVDSGHLQDNPAKAVKFYKSDTEGYYIWSLDDIKQFVKAHPAPSMAYRALVLLLFTGVRRSDVIKLNSNHIKDGVLRFKTAKTKAELIMRPVKTLQESVNPCKGIFIRNGFDEPFASGNAFGNWFKDRCKEAGLPQCSAHGLRKAGASIAAENGATEFHLDAMYGWLDGAGKKQKVISRTYTRNANKSVLASAGFEIIEKIFLKTVSQCDPK